MISEDIDAAARQYYYAIRKPGGNTRSQIRMEAAATYGKDAPMVMARLDEMMSEAPVLMAMGPVGHLLHGFLGEKKGKGIFGLGILSGEITKRKKKW